MKVALFVHCFFPEHFYGTETYTFDLARNLRNMGHEVVVVSAIFRGEPTKGSVITQYEYQDIPVYCIDKNFFPHRRVRDTFIQPELYPVIRGVLEQIKPDLVHVTHLINHTAVLLDAAKDLGIPLVATLTDFFGFCFTNKLESADGSLCPGPNLKRTNCIACFLKAFILKSRKRHLKVVAGNPLIVSFLARVAFLLARVPFFGNNNIAAAVADLEQRPDILAERYSSYKAVVTPSKFLHNAYLRNALSIPAHNLTFGVDISPIEHKKTRRGLPVRFGFIGQLAAHKGTDLLIDAFKKLPAGSAELHIFGPEDQSPDYMKTLRGKAAGLSIFFRGTFPKEHMAAILSGLDFLVIPSTWHENSPLVLLYALACHVPVIVSDVAGLTEFIEPGRSGYIFTRGDINDLARVLKKIVDAPDESRSLSSTTAYTKTTMNMSEEVLNIYKAVLSDI